MKTPLALLGGVVLALYVLSLIGVGNFTFIYGPDKFLCAKDPT